MPACMQAPAQVVGARQRHAKDRAVLNIRQGLSVTVADANDLDIRAGLKAGSFHRFDGAEGFLVVVCKHALNLSGWL